MIKRCVLAFVVLAAAIEGASAAAFPSRPILMIVPSAAGGPTDTLARILAEAMRASLGQPIVIEDQGAAGGTVAVGRVAAAAPDGYTIGIGQWGNYVLNGAIYHLHYDLLNDFAPVALLASNPQIIVTRNGLPAQDLRGLIAWLNANPETATQGTAGAGSPAHVAGLYFQQATGTRFRFVPYRGAAPAMQDLLAGRIDLMLDQASNATPQVLAGRIKAYAVTAKTRVTAAPDVPTVDEAGLPGFYISVWHGLWVPRDTPREIVATLNGAIVNALADPRVREQLDRLGQQIPPRDRQTPEALKAFQKSEADKWWPIVKAANISAE